MSGQNILKFYGSKLDLKLDNSETYDFIVDSKDWTDLILDNSENFDLTVDKTGWVDLVLDYSELYDYQLDFTVDYEIPIVYDKKVSSEFGCDYTILTQDQFSILTQNGECIQYQH